MSLTPAEVPLTSKQLKRLFTSIMLQYDQPFEVLSVVRHGKKNEVRIRLSKTNQEKVVVI